VSGAKKRVHFSPKLRHLTVFYNGSYMYRTVKFLKSNILNPNLNPVDSVKE